MVKQKIAIDKLHAQMILEYLSAKPFKEVEHLVPLMRAGELVEYELDPPKPKPNKKKDNA